ncbi:MAG: hypothetical protein RLZZ50_916, partial [Verrucomicrobiota bacterium]
GVYLSLFAAHPPFQIDANFGYVAGIIEMLLQSHLRAPDGRPVLHLLPALPAAWPEGSVNGLRARGGFTVDLAWAAGKLVRARITSRSGAPFRVIHGPESADLTPPAGSSWEWSSGTFG